MKDQSKRRDRYKKMNSVTTTIIFVSTLFCFTTSSPTGAPLVACDTMTPAHNESAQTIASPFATVPQKVFYCFSN